MAGTTILCSMLEWKYIKISREGLHFLHQHEPINKPLILHYIFNKFRGG